MPRFTEYITKNGKRKYRANIFIGIDPLTGKKIESTRMVRTKKEGNLLERQLRTDFENGVFKAESQKYTFREVYDMWLKEYEKTVKDSTLLKTTRMFKNHILPAFGDTYISKITPLMAQQQVNSWAEKFAKPGAMINYAGLVFNYAQRMQLINTNPAKLVKKPAKRSKNAVNRFNFYDADQLKIFLEALDAGFSPRVKAYFRLLAFTGMRKAEAGALRWIDVTPKIINIDKAIVRNAAGLYVGSPKTSTSTRRISLDRETYQILLEWKEIQNPAKEDWLIFSDDGHRIQSLDTSRKWLLKIQDIMDTIAKRKLPRITVHGLRHTHASLLFESGATIKQVQDRLGHTDITTTMDIYTHVSRKSKEDTADKFAEYLKVLNNK